MPVLIICLIFEMLLFHISHFSQYFSALEAGEKLTFNSATNTMGPRKFLHYGNFKKVTISKLLRFDLYTSITLISSSAIRRKHFKYFFRQRVENL